MNTKIKKDDFLEINNFNTLQSDTIDRQLTGIFYPVDRGEKTEMVDISDLTEEEQKSIIFDKKLDIDSLLRMQSVLSDCMTELVECAEGGLDDLKEMVNVNDLRILTLRYIQLIKEFGNVWGIETIHDETD